MSIQSYCQFLFNASAERVFDMNRISIPQGVDKTKFVEQCLELAVKVNVYLFTHKDAVMLIDPRAFNKQCQLYALRACQIQRDYPQKTEEEKMSATDENRFLHLGFLLNYEFRDKINYVQTVLTTLQRMGVKPYNAEFTAKGFKTFLKDRERHLEQAARMAFNKLFKEDIQTALASQKEGLGRELSVLSKENLLLPGTSLGVKGELLYTYPKLAGLAYLMDALAREKFQFILKVKVVNQEGCGGIVRYESGPIREEDPVVVFSAFATDGSFSVMEAMDKAKKCPTYLYRHSQPKTRHPENEKCFYCNPVEMDMVGQQERLNRVMKHPTDLIFSLGVEFMEQEQTTFLPYFKDSEKYPELQRLFEQSSAKLKELDLETNGVRSLAIYHTFTEMGRTAQSDDFALDYSPERFLKAKEIIQPYRTKLGLAEFCAEKQLGNLSRGQRKEIMRGFEKELNQQGFTAVKIKHKV